MNNRSCYETYSYDFTLFAGIVAIIVLCVFILRKKCNCNCNKPANPSNPVARMRYGLSPDQFPTMIFSVTGVDNNSVSLRDSNGNNYVFSCSSSGSNNCNAFQSIVGDNPTMATLSASGGSDQMGMLTMYVQGVMQNNNKSFELFPTDMKKVSPDFLTIGQNLQGNFVYIWFN